MKFKSFSDLHNWITQRTDQVQERSLNTDCLKWKKWIQNDEIPFPCVCSTRNEECIFMETYYELQQAYYLFQKERQYLEALHQYNKDRYNKNAVFEWVKFYESLGSELIHFSKIIKIKIEQEPYQVKKIVLPESEIQNLLKFQEIFNEYYYSEEYENY